MVNVASGQRLAVLVVEDEPIIRLTAVDMVEDAGFDALEAGNADEAVRILESRPDIRIVFTDIDMPGSMDGVRLAAALHQRWPEIEVILASGYKAPNMYDLPEGSVFFSKPYREREVVAALRRMAM